MTQALVDQLVVVAQNGGSPRLTPIIDRLRRPVEVAVAGRTGVGRGSVARALRQRGVAVVPPDTGGDGFDVCVLVIAETLKAEDVAAARSTRRPVLIVLTKADLAGGAAQGPIAVARARAIEIERRTGTPAVPVVGLLAALGGAGELDAELVAALRRFVTEPPNLTSVDAFVGEPHSVAGDVRGRLLARLDRFGIAHAVLAFADGCAPDRLSSHLSRVGNLDEVVRALDAVSAPARYRRVSTAISEIRSLAAQLDDHQLSGLLADDVVVMAAMTAAVDVVTAAGLSVDPGDTAPVHRERAVHWRRYGSGPVNALHRRCSADIVRGSLRLLDGSRRGSP